MVVFTRLWWEYPCGKFELFIGGRYWGLYAIGYPIDSLQLELKTDSRGLYNEYLFKKKTFENSEWDPGLRGETPMAGYEIKNLVDDEAAAWDALRTYYSRLESADSPSQIYGMVDVDNVIDVYLFLNLMQGIDNWPKNMYTTMKRTDTGYKVLYTPWDLDLTWGNGYTEEPAANFTVPYGLALDKNKSILDTSPLGRLVQLGDETIDERILERYRSLRSGAWSEEALLRMLGEMEERIYSSGAYERDRARWPEGTYQDSALGLSRFKQYVQDRLRVTDAYMEETHGAR